MFIRAKKGQSTLEYAIIIAVVIAGLIAMQFYIKRGTQGRLRSASDDMGKQFDPLNTTANYTTTTNSFSTENTTSGITSMTSDANQQRAGNEQIDTLNAERW